MLSHVERVAGDVEPERLIGVVGREADAVSQILGEGADCVVQAEQKGTGHAVMMAEESLRNFEGDVLILYGDTPLLRGETLLRMQGLKAETGADLMMLTAVGDIPGRVVRDAEGRVERIVEAQDASPEELALEERNTGVYLVSSELLWAGLGKIESGNNQGELYLTDVVGYAVETGHRVEALRIEDPDECLGINDRAQLAQANRAMRQRINEGWMAQGVTLLDPETTYIDATVEIGADTVIEPGCCITGATSIGSGVVIKANCYIEDSRLDDDVVFGPYSHLRPHSHLMDGVKIGNFVEVKNSTLGPGSKSAHLTYIGDADVGSDVNFGCGSVVVNYDGYAKSRSKVADGAFIGCNVNLISPVEIEARAFLAAGSTISQDVPEDALGVARARQRNIEGWVARKEGRLPGREAGAEARGEADAAPLSVEGKKNKEKLGQESGRGEDERE
jgi:bifunctional UDP-N-acetylglucosamine pyrophosphorylase/glucosamine-1-phosphate N-acetyltransferase